jgi:hypothetical protein
MVTPSGSQGKKGLYFILRRIVRNINGVHLVFEMVLHCIFGEAGVSRLLAYVYLIDETFLNAEIIKQGYGFAYTRYPLKFIEEFRLYEREAREEKRGLWR